MEDPSTKERLVYLDKVASSADVMDAIPLTNSWELVEFRRNKLDAAYREGSTPLVPILVSEAEVSNRDFELSPRLLCESQVCRIGLWSDLGTDTAEERRTADASP